MSDHASAASAIDPPSDAVIGLAYAETILAGLILIVSSVITWKHGKLGMVCWSIFVSAPIAVMIADIYLIVNKDQPLIPSAVSTMTSAAVLACISLTLIGVIYECNTMLPCPPKAWTQKILLGVTHLVNTMGIAVATYGGAPDATGEGGVKNQKLNQIGNLLMLFVLFTVCGWMWPTYKKIRHYSHMCHPNALPAKNMFWLGGVIAMPFWIIRIGYNALYAFDHQTGLDPVMGSFAVKLVLLFGMWFGISVVLCIAGWRGVPVGKPDAGVEYLGEGREYDENNRNQYDDTRGLRDVEMIVQGKR